MDTEEIVMKSPSRNPRRRLLELMFECVRKQLWILILPALKSSWQSFCKNNLLGYTIVEDILPKINTICFLSWRS